MVMNKKLQSQSHEKSQDFFSFIWEIIKITVLALIIILPIRYYVAQPFLVKGASMEPAFENGDYLIIDEISYRFSEPRRSEAIVFRFPEDPKQFFIKRIIGLPGETVEVKNNQIFIYNEDDPNGFIIDESSYLDPEQKTEGWLKIGLGGNEYFVLGDNRIHSSDSRRWGPLEEELIIGRVLIRAWPVQKAEYYKR